MKTIVFIASTAFALSLSAPAALAQSGPGKPCTPKDPRTSCIYERIIALENTAAEHKKLLNTADGIISSQAKQIDRLQQDTVNRNGNYLLQNTASGQCLTVSGSTPTFGPCPPNNQNAPATAMRLMGPLK